MSFRIRVLLAMSCALAAVTLTVGLISAVGWPLWQEDGVALCVATNDQENPQIISDDAGGAIVTWKDVRGSDQPIYARRVYSDGTPAWTTDGVRLSVAAKLQRDPQIVSDDSGGAIVTWAESTGSGDDIYAQRVDSGGNILWNLNGVSLCVVFQWQQNPQIASDGSEGTIVTWQDLRNLATTHRDIYAQRVYSDGTTAWATNGVSLCAALYEQQGPQIVPDGAGGAIATWTDYRTNTDNDIYTQRVYSNGTVAWTTDGVSLCVESDHQSEPQIVSDGSGGAIVTWKDERGYEFDIYAQRVLSDGTVAWTTDGVSLSAASVSQYDPQIASDGSGGAIVTWYEYRGGTSGYDIYAQRVYSDGTPAWTTDGVSLSVASDNQRDPQITSDGSGGAIVTWKDERGSDSDIYAQRVDADGNVQWEANGVRLGAATDDQVDPQLAPAPNGGAIVTWADYRDSGTSGYDIYAQRVGDLSPGLHLPLALKRYE